MQFCSRYAYDYGFNGSDEEDNDDNVSQKVSTSKRVRRGDTNIISVNFEELISTNQMFAGEPIKCKKCDAIMTKTSISNLNEEKTVWKCEYCLELNDIQLATLDQIPNGDDVTFLIEAAPQATDLNNNSNSESVDDKYLSYCIDISGSMDTQVPINGMNRAMTRLDTVKAACIENLRALKTHEPNKRVNLVTFSESVKYFGDGTNTNDQVELGNNYRSRGYFIQSQIQRPAQDDILNNKEKIMALAQNQKGNLKPVKESHTALEQRIKSLRTEGSTALGPALTFSIGYTSRLAGSQVILCTDGCANVGIGQVENDPNAEKFYEDLASYAKSKSVVVNVITMEGNDCKLALLGKVADLTNGTVKIVNPLNLSEEFRSIIENRLIASNVKAKLIVNNKYLYIRDEDLELAEAQAYESEDAEAKKNLDKLKRSIAEKDIGNVNVETEISFEYGIKRLSDEEKKTCEKLEKLPFQLQIVYTMPNGAKALRIVTKIQEFTQDRAKAENEILSKEALWSNYAQKVSSHVTNSNAYAAKYRGQQLQNISRNLRMAMPQQMQANINMVTEMSNQHRLIDLDDMRANQVLNLKKANKKFFSK